MKGSANLREASKASRSHGYGARWEEVDDDERYATAVAAKRRRRLYQQRMRELNQREGRCVNAPMVKPHAPRAPGKAKCARCLEANHK